MACVRQVLAQKLFAGWSLPWSGRIAWSGMGLRRWGSEAGWNSREDMVDTAGTRMSASKRFTCRCSRTRLGPVPSVAACHRVRRHAARPNAGPTPHSARGFRCDYRLRARRAARRAARGPAARSATPRCRWASGSRTCCPGSPPTSGSAMLHQYGPAVPRLGVEPFRTGTEALHGVAWLGPATVFPQAVGLGAHLGRRAAARGRHRHLRPSCGPSTSTGPARGRGRHSLQAWAPVVNLLRDPRWGRNEEGYSEDPLLSARLGARLLPRHVGRRPARLRTAPILKHFLAYNNEDDRCTTSSGVRPRVLHEYDLAAFRQAVAGRLGHRRDGRYNLVNGRPCHVSPLHRERAAALGRADRARTVRRQRRGGALQPGRPASTTSTTTPPRTPPRSRPASTASPTTARTRGRPSAGSARRWSAD